MSETPVRSWEEANQTYLMAALSEVRATLERLLSRPEAPSAAGAPSALTTPENVRATMALPPAIETLCATFSLSSFERNILLMCAGNELDSRFASLYAAANKDT